MYITGILVSFSEREKNNGIMAAIWVFSFTVEWNYLFLTILQNKIWKFFLTYVVIGPSWYGRLKMPTKLLTYYLTFLSQNCDLMGVFLHCIVSYCFLFLIPVFILTKWLVSLDKGCMCGNCHEQHLWKINDQQYENKKFWQLFCFQFTPRLSGPSKSSILNHVTTRRYCEYVAVCMP